MNSKKQQHTHSKNLTTTTNHNLVKCVRFFIEKFIDTNRIFDVGRNEMKKKINKI